MTVQRSKIKVKSKTTINNKNKSKVVKKKKKGKKVEEKKRINSNLLKFVAFLTTILLIVASYAWLSAALDVKLKFFDLIVSSDNGLFVSLDGIDYSDSVEISMDGIINDLKSTYPNNSNQWADAGLWPVSSNGIKNSNNDKFDVYVGEVSRYINGVRNNRRFLTTTLVNEDKSSSNNIYIAFDIFLKNVSGSPNSDNLYLDEGTLVDFDENTEEDIKDSMSNIMNSMRFGFIKINSVPSKTDVYTIQNLKCNNNCQVVLYEPNSTIHTSVSIENAQNYGISLTDGVYTPTYAVINEGKNLDHTNGHEGSSSSLDTERFALQKTITDFSKPIFKIPNGVTKLRTYVWIEGQDMDSLETISKGAAVYLSINFEKDLAGYE